MPQAVASVLVEKGITALLVKLGVSATVSAKIGSMLGAVAGVYVSSLLNKDKPDSIEFDEHHGIQSNISGSVTHQKIIYGERLVGGQIFYFATSNNVKDMVGMVEDEDYENRFLHMMLAICGQEIDSFQNIYLNDEDILENQFGYSNLDTYKGEFGTLQFGIESFRVRATQGKTYSFAGYDSYQDAHEEFMTTKITSITLGNLPRDMTDFFQSGDIITVDAYDYAYTFSVPEHQKVTLTSNASTDSNGQATIYFASTDQGIFYDLNSKPYVGSTASATETLTYRAGGVTVENRNHKSRVFAQKFLGTQTQVPTQEMVDDVEHWTSDHKATGISFLYTRFQYSPDSFKSIPNITALVKGKKIYDPRKDSTNGGSGSHRYTDSSTWEWSDNPALILRDYLISDFGLEVDNTSIDDTYTISASNVCDELVALKDGGTEKRYRCDVVIPMGGSEDQHFRNIEFILSTMLGQLTYVQGKYRIYAGEFQTPTTTINEDWLMGNISFQTNIKRSSLYNQVTGVYTDADNSDKLTSFPTVSDDTYKSDDGGKTLTKDINLFGVRSVEQAQRLARIILNKGRNGVIVNMPVSLKGAGLSTNDTVYVNNTILGWVNKTFRVLEWTLNKNMDGVSLVLQEDSTATYAHDASALTVLSSTPNTTKTHPTTVQKPGNPIIEELLYVTANSAGVKNKVKITFSPSSDAFVRRYQVEYRASEHTQGYVVLGQTESNSFDALDLPAGNYSFRVKAINGIGASSAYSETLFEVKGLTEPPQDISNFSINIINNNAHLSWDKVPDLDVLVGGSIIIKHTEETASPNWPDGIEVVPAQSGTSTQVVAPLLTGTYMIKAKDSVNNVSQTAQTLSITVPDIVKMNVVTSLTDHTAFTGTKTNMVVDTGVLKLDGVVGILFDSVTGNFDDATGSFDAGNGSGFEDEGEYAFSTYIDIGKVVTCRNIPHIKFVTTNPGNNFDDFSGLFDDATGYFDGTDSDPINIEFYIQTTNDDPSASPTWSSWRKFYIGDFTARAFQFKIKVTNKNKAFNCDISELSVSVDMPDVVDSNTNTTSTGGLSTINYAQTFYTTPTVGGSIINGDSGDYLVISNKTSTGFDVGVKNSGGSWIAKDVAWISKGY